MQFFYIYPGFFPTFMLLNKLRIIHLARCNLVPFLTSKSQHEISGRQLLH